MSESLKASDLRSKTISDLKDELFKKEQEYKSMEIDHTVKGLESPIELRTERKNIARLKTVIKEKQQEEK